MASTGMSDTQSYSVIFQDTSFDEHEYMFMNDLGTIPDLTMDKFMRKAPDLGNIDDLTLLRKVPRSVLESSAYELSDAESPQIPVPPSPIPILDLGYIAPDPDDVRGCT